MPEFAEWMVTAIEIDFPYPDTTIAKKDGSVAIGQRVFLLERAARRNRLGVKRAELNVSISAAVPRQDGLIGRTSARRAVSSPMCQERAFSLLKSRD